MRVFFIDNPSSFTYNLVDDFEKRDCEALAYGDDADIKLISNAITKFRPNLIVVCSDKAVDIIQTYQGQIPIFGVGLGQLSIIKAFEGKVSRTPVIHGKINKIKHDEKTIFKKINNPFNAGTYCSLSASDVPYSLEVSARNENNVVMGVRHKEVFVEGVQLDPSSLLTVSGGLIIENLLKEIGKS